MIQLPELMQSYTNLNNAMVAFNTTFAEWIVGANISGTRAWGGVTSRAMPVRTRGRTTTRTAKGMVTSLAGNQKKLWGYIQGKGEFDKSDITPSAVGLRGTNQFNAAFQGLIRHGLLTQTGERGHYKVVHQAGAVAS